MCIYGRDTLIRVSTPVSAPDYGTGAEAEPMGSEKARRMLAVVGVVIPTALVGCMVWLFSAVWTTSSSAHSLLEPVNGGRKLCHAASSSSAYHRAV